MTGRYGNDGADDKKLIILLLYLALHIPLSYSHACSGDILCVGLHPTEICRPHACLFLHVCAPPQYFGSCHGNIKLSDI